MIDGAINVDIVDHGMNVVHDLNQVPYPFPDNEFDMIVCRHVLEHLRNFHSTITELYRIAKQGARVHVTAPFFLNTKYFGDPDHRIPFSIRSFDNYEYLNGRRLRFYETWKIQHRNNYDAHVYFRIITKRFNMSNFRALRWFNVIANLDPVIYERVFAGILSPEECIFELEVIKPA
jgi:ubiquinone/menaquinone biosynthesis C-methylase UbiE